MSRSLSASLVESVCGRQRVCYRDCVVRKHARQGQLAFVSDVFLLRPPMLFFSDVDISFARFDRAAYKEDRRVAA